MRFWRGRSTRKEVERRIVNVDHMARRVRNIQLDQQLEELQAYAVEVFGDHDAALRWLDTGLSELDDLSAREIVIRTGARGLERARDVLLRIEYGSVQLASGLLLSAVSQEITPLRMQLARIWQADAGIPKAFRCSTLPALSRLPVSRSWYTSKSRAFLSITDGSRSTSPRVDRQAFPATWF
jgi:hypothetical protein